MCCKRPSRARATARDVAFGPGLQDRGRDGAIFSRQRCARNSRSRLLQISAARSDASRCTIIRLPPSARIATSFWATGFTSIRDGSGRRPGTAPLHRQSRRLCRLCGVGLEIAAGKRSSPTTRSTNSASRPAFRSCSSSARPALAPACRAADGVILDQLPSAPSRSGRGALSRAEDRRRAPGLAVADRDDRRADAQAQHLVRAARLVAEISHRRSQARHSAAPEGSGHVRRRLSAVRLRAAGARTGIAEGYAPEMLEKLFHRNAETFFQSLGLAWT